MRNVFFFLSILFLFFIIYNLSQSLYSLWQKQDLLVNAKTELEQEKQKNKQLKTQLHSVQDPSFIEKEARNKLLYVRPGEKIVVFSDKLIVKEKKTISAHHQQPYWKQWWDLFIK